MLHIQDIRQSSFTNTWMLRKPSIGLEPAEVLLHYARIKVLKRFQIHTPSGCNVQWYETLEDILIPATKRFQTVN